MNETSQDADRDKLIEKMSEKFPLDTSRGKVVRELMAQFDKYVDMAQDETDSAVLATAACLHALVSSLLVGKEHILAKMAVSFETALAVTNALKNAIGEEDFNKLGEAIVNGDPEALKELQKKLTEAKSGLDITVVDMRGNGKKTDRIKDKDELPPIIPLGFNVKKGVG